MVPSYTREHNIRTTVSKWELAAGRWATYHGAARLPGVRRVTKGSFCEKFPGNVDRILLFSGGHKVDTKFHWNRPNSAGRRNRQTLYANRQSIASEFFFSHSNRHGTGEKHAPVQDLFVKKGKMMRIIIREMAFIGISITRNWCVGHYRYFLIMYFCYRPSRSPSSPGGNELHAVKTWSALTSNVTLW